MFLSRPIRCELSRLCGHGHSLLLSSYLHRISRKENSACSACGHPLQDLNHLLLDCPASEPLRKSIFGSSLSILDLWSLLWGVPDCWVSAEFLRTPIPRKGSVVPPPPRSRKNGHNEIKWVCFYFYCTPANKILVRAENCSLTLDGRL